MRTALRYRLLRTGRFTAEQRAAVEMTGVLFAQQGIPVRSVSTALKLPGQNRNSGSRLLVGAVVITASSVHAALGALDLGAAGLTAEPPVATAALTVGTSGVSIDVNVGKLVAGGSGTAVLTFDVEIPAALLDALAGPFGALPMTPVIAQRLSRRL